MLLPILTHKLKEAEVEIEREKSKGNFMEINLEEDRGFTKEEPSPPLFKLLKIFKEAFYKKKSQLIIVGIRIF